MELNDNDKKRIWLEIKISTIIPIIFFVLIVLLLAIGFGVTAFFVKVKPGFLNRSLTILLCFIIPFLYFVWLSVIKYADLKRNVKNRIKLDDYKLKKIKKNVFLISEKANLKIKIFEELAPLIDINTPLTIEFTKYSKMLLFISNDNQNLLDKIEKI